MPQTSRRGSSVRSRSPRARRLRRRARSSASRRRPGTRRWCAGARRTSRRATRSRSCRRSARREGRLPSRSSCTGRCGRQPVAVPLPARAGRARPRGLVARAARRLRGRARERLAIAGTTAAGEGDVEQLASEKDRAEHVMLVDLGRNDLSRVCRAGTVRVARSLEIERFSTSRISCPRSSASCARRGAVRRAARLLSGRHRHGRAQGARDADHLRARGLPAAPPRAVVGYVLPGGTMDTCIALRTMVVADGSCISRPVRAWWRTPTRAEHECLAKLAALEADRLAEEVRVKLLMVDNYDSFTWNLSCTCSRARRRGRRLSQRRDHGRGGRGARARPARDLAGAGTPRGRGCPSSSSERSARARRLPRPPGDRRSIRRPGRTHRRCCTASRASFVTTARVYAGLPERGSRQVRYHCCARTRGARRSRGHRADGGRRGDGRRHRVHRIEGVQFHPESVLTPSGPELAANFLR